MNNWSSNKRIRYMKNIMKAQEEANMGGQPVLRRRSGLQPLLSASPNSLARHIALLYMEHLRKENPTLRFLIYVPYHMDG